MTKLLKFLFLFITGIILLYIYMPTINFGFTGLAALLIFLAIGWTLLNNPFTLIQGHNNTPTIKLNKLSKVPLILITITVIYMTIVPAITGWPIFHSERYRNLIGDVKPEANLSTHMLPISLDRIRVVDQALAELLGDKVLGSQSALGSQVTLGTFNIQKVNNDLYWVAPLLHSGFFKWRKNTEGTNGYVMVNACNERDVKLVQDINGKKIFIKYQPEAYFGDNLKRHLYFNGYWATGLTDYSFEIDDYGTPYWVVTRYKKTIGFNGEDAQGIVVLNAQTGEIKDYNISNAPAWIDRIQPGNFIEKQLNDWGEYVKGYWNFSNEGKLQITEDATLVYGEDNKAYWYTGLTSVGADESTVGFVLVDTRTKKTVWYKQSGATEYAAQNSAKGKVQEKGYSASQPIPYNINNIPTYVMTLKDQGGLVKMYAMVAIEDYTIVGVGNTLRETLMAYKNAFNQSGNKISTKSKTIKNLVKSIITRINGDVKNGNTYYYFSLKGENRIFIGSSQISNDFPITNIGDSVYITFENDNQDVTDVSTFTNKNIRANNKTTSTK